MKKVLGVIPARFHSQRFPGKPLANILGKPMIQWVYEGAKTSSLCRRLIIATDDKRIAEAAQKFGAETCLTSPSHSSGTERVAEVAEQMDYSYILNIQGDEPLLKGEILDSLIEGLAENDIYYATLAAPCRDKDDFLNPNTVKVVLDHEGYALYFSRAPVPFNSSSFFWRHIGIYGYRREFLLKFSRTEPSFLEKKENLEQLRALENGYRLKIIKTSYRTLSVDTPQDIIKVEKILKQESNA